MKSPQQFLLIRKPPTATGTTRATEEGFSQPYSEALMPSVRTNWNGIALSGTKANRRSDVCSLASLREQDPDETPGRPSFARLALVGFHDSHILVVVDGVQM